MKNAATKIYTLLNHFRPLGRVTTLAVTRSAAIAIILTGCSHSVTGTAHSEPSHQFPDLDTFSSVDAKTFFAPQRGGPSYQFTTTAGVKCRVTLGGVGCWGNIPAIPESVPPGEGDGCGLVGTDLDINLHTSPYTFSRSDGQCPPFDDHRQLKVGEKTTLYMMTPASITCAAGPDNMLACIDTDKHGFVIEPSGSWTF